MPRAVRHADNADLALVGGPIRTSNVVQVKEGDIVGVRVEDQPTLELVVEADEVPAFDADQDVVASGESIATRPSGETA